MAVQRSQKLTVKKEADLVLWMSRLNLISLAILTRSRGLRYVLPCLRTSVYTILLDGGSASNTGFYAPIVRSDIASVDPTCTVRIYGRNAY